MFPMTRITKIWIAVSLLAVSFGAYAAAGCCSCC
jgi:hypothetical protein